MIFQTVAELTESACGRGIRVWQAVVSQQAEITGKSEQEVMLEMTLIWEKMLESMKVKRGIRSASGLVGEDAARLENLMGNSFLGGVVISAITRALATAETNAFMGIIVAAPTAGSCGIIPAAISAVGEFYALPRDDMVKSLFTSAGIGMVIAKNASLSGAEGGCQAECGAAAAMAAAGVVELVSGNPEKISHAAALALKNMLGLVCDPVAGLVEVPCVKRNAFAAVHALTAAQMALAGVESVIPVDEVIEAMYRIGLLIPAELRETAISGLADTPTGRRIATVVNDIS